jgi:hypothetical protein
MGLSPTLDKYKAAALTGRNPITGSDPKILPEFS